jgi:hypothetical protein
VAFPSIVSKMPASNRVQSDAKWPAKCAIPGAPPSPASRSRQRERRLPGPLRWTTRRGFGRWPDCREALNATEVEPQCGCSYLPL